MSDGKKLKPQHAPNPPHQNPKFLASTPARPIRILGEYIHPLVQLKKEGIADTIVMFGSARIESHETAQPRVTPRACWRCPAITKKRASSRIRLQPGRLPSAQDRGVSSFVPAAAPASWKRRIAATMKLEASPWASPSSYRTSSLQIPTSVRN